MPLFSNSQWPGYLYLYFAIQKNIAAYLNCSFFFFYEITYNASTTTKKKRFKYA